MKQVQISYDEAMQAFDKAIEKFKRVESGWLNYFYRPLGVGRGSLAFLQRFSYEFGDATFFTLSGNLLSKETLKKYVDTSNIGDEVFVVDDILETQFTIEEIIKLFKRYKLWNKISRLYVIVGYKRERKAVEAMGLKYCDLSKYGDKVKVIYGERIRHTKYLKFDWEKLYFIGVSGS